MYERCLNEAERVLAGHKNILVPVKEVWGIVQKRCSAVGAETAGLADFTAMLEADPRFELIPAQAEDSDFKSQQDEDGEMEQMGIHEEDQVKLRRIKIAKEEVDESPAVHVKGLGVSSQAPVAHKGTGAKKKTRRTLSAAKRRTKKPVRKPSSDRKKRSGALRKPRR
ncbi:MAG: hypothetical protein HY966_06045 [Ignavibacteriales bacterium]|nr:hypothetical protein [Ignavibacteriales bacterium]